MISVDTMAGFIPLPFSDINSCNSASMTTIDFIDMSDDDDNYSSSSPNADSFWDSEPTLPTPPYSPCSSVDEPGSDLPDDSCCVNSVEGSELTSTSSFSVVRPRCNSFLCSCMACECCCSTRADGPVLRDCMWSATTGLFPPLPIDRREPTCLGRNVDAKCTVASVGLDVNGNGCSSGRRVATAKTCTNHTTYCVDPKTIFPYPMFPAKASCDVTGGAEVLSNILPKSLSNCQSVPAETPVTPPASIVFDPDSDSASTSSSLSDDDMDEIDVVSIASVSRLSPAETCISPMTATSRLLVLPAAESMSAQVAAIHNYSTTRCQPAQTIPRPSITTIHHQNSYNMVSSAKYARQYQQRSLKNHRSSRRRNSKTHHKSRCLSEDDDYNNNNNSFVPSEERCKRAQHNVMERQRRNHLKGNFFSLRDCLPTLYSEHRVSKVTILRAGAEHIAKLTAAHEALVAERNRLRALQQRWKWKLSLVQRDVRLSTSDVPV